MRIGVFGGTFNPIHVGHLQTAAEARGQLDLDRVLFVPTTTPPHKEAEVLISGWRRYVMVELALLDVAWAKASPRELRQQTSYSIETLEGLASADPDSEWVLLIGSDSLAELTTWRRWRDLLGFEIGVLDRRGPGCPETGTIPDELAAVEGARIRWVENRLVRVSSTDIRQRLKSGAAPTELADDLHPRVLEYVDKYSLYR